MNINIKEATEQGYRPLTEPYNLPNEQWMLDNAIKDMVRDNIDYALVEDSRGTSLWRKGMMFGDPLVKEAMMAARGKA